MPYKNSSSGRHRRILASLIFVVLSLLTTLASGQEGLSGDPSFIAPDAFLERIVNGNDFSMSSLGNVAVGCDNLVYMSDIKFSNSPASYTPRETLAAGVIWRYNPTTTLTDVFRSPSGMANGIAFNAECDMIVAEGADFGGRRLTRTYMPRVLNLVSSEPRLEPGLADIVAGLYMEAPFNAPNDVVIDEKGRLYFTDPRYQGHELVEQEVNGVYRVDPDGTVVRIIDDRIRPNGITLAPNQRTLYIADFTNRGQDDALVAYDLDEEGNAEFREVLIAYPQRGADAMVVDTEGNIWAAVLDTTRPGVYAYTPDGEEKAYIPVKSPFGVSFGRGVQRHTLYITAQKSLYRITVRKEGYHLPLQLAPETSN